MKRIKKRTFPPRVDEEPALVLLVHGIRTEGAWQKAFASAISGSTTKIESFEFGNYGLVRFLWPQANDRMVDKFYNWYKHVCESHPSIVRGRKPSVVAHSFGTWIVGMAMMKFEDIVVDRVVFAGSILPTDFPWQTLYARGQIAALRNECGQKDPWSQWARRLVSKTGTGGVDGFDWFSGDFENCRFEWYGHSEPLMRGHICSYWLPFLRRSSSPLVLVHGRQIDDQEQFSSLLDHSGTVLDKAAYGALPNYSEVEIPRGLALSWIRVNPDIYTFLIDRSSGEVAGYVNAMPVVEYVYDEIRKGNKTDNEIMAGQCVPYTGATKRLKIYLMSIVIGDRYRRWGQGVFQQAYIQLMAGLFDKLTFYAKNHRVRVTHILATSWTPEGGAICQNFDMTEVGKDRFGDTIFELDIDALVEKSRFGAPSALNHLIREYKRL